MFKTPVRVSSDGKRIILGGQSHIIGEHLSTFVNTDFQFFKLCQSSVYGILDDSYLILNEEEFNKIKSFFKELFYICFSDSFLLDQGAKPEYIKQASKVFASQRRYLYYLKKHQDFIKELNISYNIDFYWYVSNWRSILNTKTDDTSKLVHIFNNPTELDIALVSTLNSEPAYIEHVTVTNFQSFLYYEFNKIIQFNIPVKQCKNCGLYFVPEGRSDSLYCNNYYNSSGKTCREIGTSNVYKEKINKNDIHKIYNRHYKKMYARHKNKWISQEELLNWSNIAREERDKAIKNGLSADEFTKIIEELEG